MPKFRGVDKSATVRLTLSEGDWLDVRKQLTVGEERTIARLSAKSYEQTTGPDGEGRFRIEYDFLKQGFLRAASYIVGWSLLDFHGQAIVWPANFSLDKKVAILEGLDSETQSEIEDAIIDHVKAQQEARDAAKKAPAGSTGETPSEATSPSAAS